MNGGARVDLFTSDATDVAVIRRCTTWKSTGKNLCVYSFSRDRYTVTVKEDWTHINLGTIVNGHFLVRAFRLAWSLPKILKDRTRVKHARVIYARNLDMALLALIQRSLLRLQAPLVYEVLDIHRAMTQGSARGAVLRWLERRVLRHVELLVVSSPAYVREYFRRVQGFNGKWHLIENKLSGEQISTMKRPRIEERMARVSRRVRLPSTWTLGWFGTLSDVPSLSILGELAERMAGSLRVIIRGIPETVGRNRLMAAVQEHSNLEYGGPYDAMRDLGVIYEEIDFVWCGDIHPGDANQNKLWLLPNRLYEAGYFGVPVLAVQGTETGSYVERNGLGWTLGSRDVGEIQHFLESLTVEQYRAMVERIMARDTSFFAGDRQMVGLFADL